MDKSEFLKALSDKTRLRILEFLKEGEHCACSIVPYTKKSQPNVSLHLKKLKETGIIESRKEGTMIYYRINDPKVFKILEILK